MFLCNFLSLIFEGGFPTFFHLVQLISGNSRTVTIGTSKGVIFIPDSILRLRLYG